MVTLFFCWTKITPKISFRLILTLIRLEIDCFFRFVLFSFIYLFISKIKFLNKISFNFGEPISHTHTHTHTHTKKNNE